MSLKIVSVNIEWTKHIPTVKAFLAKENADVVCLMEAWEGNLDELLPNHPHRVFAPNFRLHDERKIGVVVASKTPFVHTMTNYCDGVDSTLPYSGMGTHRPVVVIGGVQDGNDTIAIGAVHFTWTPDGCATDAQRADVDRLIELMKKKELILCGDFNIPRDRNELYKRLAAVYTDNIPLDVTSTIDPHLHRVNMDNPGKLALMVDYIWSTPAHTIQNVRVVSGVSDHCALTADIV